MIDLLGELEGLQCHSTTGTLSNSSKNMHATIIECLLAYIIHNSTIHGNQMHACDECFVSSSYYYVDALILQVKYHESHGLS